MQDDNTIDFSTVIASAVHDMKNSLGMLLSTLDEFFSELPEELRDSPRQAILQYEAERVNIDLIQLLGLYRLEHEQLSVRVDEQFVRDFLEEQVARYSILAKARNIVLDIDCDENLLGYFDGDLISGIINNILANAARYTQDRILLLAGQADGGVVIEVHDDGVGYPDEMLDSPGRILKGISFKNGSTSLGLFFAAKVAKMHRQGDKTGAIHLFNGGRLGGGVFRIFLP
ncbi:MAG: ATP-binding protein [Gammaproteobacteria bacterium]|nr:MAG: ATP-binding protein [Pseudomonadota bacterium]PIE38801.1 MAG: ATP-binding protein [Gammaproteobacteria bacterium]